MLLCNPVPSVALAVFGGGGGDREASWLNDIIEETLSKTDAFLLKTE